MEIRRSRLIPKLWPVPDAFHLRLGESAGRQRLMDEDGHLLLILHTVPRAEDDAERQAAFFWRDPAGGWKSAPEKGGISALKEHLDQYRAAIVQLDDQVDAATTAKQYFEILRQAAPLLRATRHLHDVLQKAREARKDDRKLLLLRDEAVDLERAIDLVSSDAKTGMEFLEAENASSLAQLSHQASLESRRLNRLVAFFFPLATLISLFGMNDPQQVVSSKAFWWVVFTGVGLGLVVRILIGAGSSRTLKD